MSESPTPTPGTRCAIYTRKSTEEGLDLEFNSLDAQREAGEAYIASQRNEGWQCLPARYDDGGFTGGNIERPALQRLLQDVEAGKVDVIVVYKVDRLSRSLLDFSKLMEVFDRHGVSFVSVTQQFNTTHSMGRLTLNILLSFAQFEREIISERTRDKIAAARRKGKWSGGRPILGYDIERGPGGSKLVVNEDEAVRVRQIFAMYLEKGSLIPTVTALRGRGGIRGRTKEWTTKKGKVMGGAELDKGLLHNMLTNVLYRGMVSYKDDVFAGEHEAIVAPELWQRVQDQLKANGNGTSGGVRNKHNALLRGLLRCTACECGMTHTYTAKGKTRYRYYTCVKAQKRGHGTCPCGSVPASEIEAFVVDQIRQVGQDPTLVAQTLHEARRKADEDLASLKAERRILDRDLQRCRKEVGQLAMSEGEIVAARLADLHDRTSSGGNRITEIEREMAALQRGMVSEQEVAEALAEFDELWEVLTPKERIEVVNLLIERVDYDGHEGTVEVTFKADGPRNLRDITLMTDEHALAEAAA